MSERVLVIVGEESSRRRVGRVLGEMGLEVIAVADGAGGRALLDRAEAEDQPFALLIADPQATGMENDDLLISSVGSGMMVIILSGQASVDSVISALRKGVCDYLLEPCDAEELKLAVRWALEKRRLEMESRVLLAVSQVLTTVLDENELLRTITELTRKTIPAARNVTIHVLDETGEWLLLRASALAGLIEDPKRGMRVGQGVAGRVVQDLRPIYVPNVDKYPCFLPLTSEAAFKSLLVVPLVIGDEGIGTLSVNSEREDAFSPADARLVTALGGQVAIALKNARLFSELERAKNELEEWSTTLERRVKERTEELERAQERLIRSEKLAALGQLSANIRHELRNPLGVMSNSIYYLRSKLADADAGVHKHLDILAREVDTANKIVGDLLDFTRVRDPILKITNVAALVRDAVGRVRKKDNVDIIWEMDGNLPYIMVDADQLRQVFVNLAQNAIEAMPDGGSLTVRGELEEGDEQSAVVIKMTDSGVGISAENMTRIFEPLFTTKARGTGLGLAICKDIVEGHGGKITVQSQVGVGTTFATYLPVRKRKGIP